MVAMIDEALGKRRHYGEPFTRAPTLKRARFVENGSRLMPVTNMSATFNKLSKFAFCVYISRCRNAESYLRWGSRTCLAANSQGQVCVL